MITMIIISMLIVITTNTTTTDWYLNELPKVKEFVKTPLGIAAVGVLAYGIYSIFLKSE